MRGLYRLLPLHGPSKFEPFNLWLYCQQDCLWLGWVKSSTFSSAFTTLTKIVHTGTGASRDLRNMFYGAIVWLPTGADGTSNEKMESNGSCTEVATSFVRLEQTNSLFLGS